METLIQIRHISQLPYGRLMELYSQDLQENARQHYPKLSANAALIAAEQDFYGFMKEVFFQTPNACLYVWAVEGQWRSALRLEPYEDGYLICGITTEPAYRRCGYAKRLLKSVLQQQNGKIYSHVEKLNFPSLQLHENCGFVKQQEWAKMLNGEILHNFWTLCYGK